jgi:hypothetical protein
VAANVAILCNPQFPVAIIHQWLVCINGIFIPGFVFCSVLIFMNLLKQIKQLATVFNSQLTV